MLIKVLRVLAVFASLIATADSKAVAMGADVVSRPSVLVAPTDVANVNVRDARSSYGIRHSSESSRVKFGVFARLSPGAAPFSLVSPARVLDERKMQNILDLGASWTRSPLSPFFTDRTFLGPGRFDWSAADVVTSWTRRHRIEPVVGIEAGPVQVNDPGTFDPHEVPVYPTPAGFAGYCRAAATHFKNVTHSYSIPGNEINSDLGSIADKHKFSSIAVAASFTQSCYRAIKAADRRAFVWGFELNMDANAEANRFVRDARRIGCGPGTCYDGLSMHLGLRYPMPSRETPCYPEPGGDYALACIPEIQKASGDARLPIMIGETVVTWPGMVPDARVQASFAASALRAMAVMPGVRYINYANLDECGLYSSGYFVNGCLVDRDNARVDAWRTVHDVFVGK